MIKSYKKNLMILLVCLFFIPCANAYDLFLDVNVWGLCTTVKIYQDSRRVIWRKNFLTPELLVNAKKESIPQMISYLNTINKRRVINKIAKLKLKKYIRIWNRSKNKLSENDIFRFSSLILVTALKNI